MALTTVTSTHGASTRWDSTSVCVSGTTEATASAETAIVSVVGCFRWADVLTDVTRLVLMSLFVRLVLWKSGLS